MSSSHCRGPAGSASMWRSYILASSVGFRAIEIPISWYYHRESRVRPHVDSILMLLDIIRVRWNDLRGFYTARPGDSSGRTSAAKTEGEMLADAPPATTTGAWKDSSMAVVVPTYNEASNLPELADRLFQLGIPKTRVIVVDDGSPDGTAEVADELAKKFDGNLQVINGKVSKGWGQLTSQDFPMC